MRFLIYDKAQMWNHRALPMLYFISIVCYKSSKIHISLKVIKGIISCWFNVKDLPGETVGLKS